MTGKWSGKRWQYVHAALYTGGGNVIKATDGTQMKVVEQARIPAEYIVFRYQGEAADPVNQLFVPKRVTLIDFVKPELIEQWDISDIIFLKTFIGVNLTTLIIFRIIHESLVNGGDSDYKKGNGMD
jgi:hypothetical protein